MSSVKTAILKVANRLTDDSTWKQAMHELWLRERIDRGEIPAEGVEVLDHDELFNELMQKEEWSDADQRLYDECVRAKLEHAHAQAEAGMMYDDDEVFAELLSDEDNE